MEYQPGNHGEVCAFTPDQRTAILTEAEFVLAHDTFKHSKRCVTLLRYLIDRALSGDRAGEKERTIGIEVFGREPDYDTNAEPVVRMAANEIRKRLAQFYQDPDHSSAVKIHLLPGSYLPKFEFVGRVCAPGEESGALAREPTVSVGSNLQKNSVASELSSSLHSRVGKAVLLVGVIALVAWLVYFQRFRADSSQIWAPLFASSEPVIVCVGDFNKPEGATDWAHDVAKRMADRSMHRTPLVHNQMPVVAFVDVAVAGRITSWLTAHHTRSSIQGSSTLSLNSLRQGPVILVGAFDNPWALILLADLRYHVRLDPDSQEEWIEDSQNPSKREWSVNGRLGYQDTSADYAIITRFLDPDTGKWILAVSGLGLHGTGAGAELLLNTEYANLLPPDIRHTKKNFQVVLQTTAIAGSTSPPHVLAVHMW